MASLYMRPESPFWFLKRKSKDGTWVAHSTGLRCENEIETAQARLLMAEANLAEAGTQQSASDGWGWVEGWLSKHWANPKTTKRAFGKWKHIEHWLLLNGLSSPALVEFRHGSEYVEWREGRVARHRACGRNTALNELKLLGQIMGVACQRGIIKANPIRKIGIAKIPPPEKREISDAEIGRCLKALEIEPEWMRLSFMIALHTGCRLSETSLEMACVDFKRNTITFPTPKGGRKRAFTRPLPEALRGILWELRARKKSHEIPAHASRSFARFFKRCGAEGVTFHNLRVSYVTRLHRASVPLSVAMRLVNHSSEIVHQIYNRLSVDDVMPWKDVPLFPSTILKNQPAERGVRPVEKKGRQPSGKRSCKPLSGTRRVP